MEADCRHEGVEGVRAPCIKLVWGRGEQSRCNVEGFDGFFQVFPVGLVPNGSGGGALVGWPGKMDEDRDMV